MEVFTNLQVSIGEKVFFLLKWNNERKQGKLMLFKKSLKPCPHRSVEFCGFFFF